MLVGIASNEIRIERVKNIKANTKGSKTVQHSDINWSKRILGKLARTHMNVKAKIQVLIPNDTPKNVPSSVGIFSCVMIH